MKLKPQCIDQFQNRRKLSIAIWRQRFVEAHATQPRIARNLCHAFGVCDIAERCAD